MPTKHTLLSWITIALLTCSWVLLLLPSIAATEGTNMSLANAIVIEEDGTEHTARFGPVGYDSDERIRVSSRGGTRDAGYFGAVGILTELQPDVGPNSTRPRRNMTSRTALRQNETEALLMFPVSLGFLVLTILAFCVGWAERKPGYQVFSALFGVATAGMAWPAWVFALNLPQKIAINLRPPSTVFQFDVWTTRAERGNAIWPGLVGVILLTVGMILIIVAIAIRPADTWSKPEVEPTHQDKTEMKPMRSRDAERDSQMTAV